VFHHVGEFAVGEQKNPGKEILDVVGAAGDCPALEQVHYPEDGRFHLSHANGGENGGLELV